MKNAPRKPFFSLHSHVISLTHIGDSMLNTKVTSKVTRGPKEAKNRSNLKKRTRYSMFSINKHIVFLSNIGYAILISNIIKGHQRSLEVKKESTFGKYIQGCSLWMLIYMITWIAIECDFFTFMVKTGQQQLNRV